MNQFFFIMALVVRNGVDLMINNLFNLLNIKNKPNIKTGLLMYGGCNFYERKKKTLHS
jgi:hypothetical protein